ncbi:MAG TPA: thioredoxin family protein [Pirellulales bacterium]|jgi:protein disulfide-isomerase|nr:thioredoxin family protein [Pirellulales bacterium]
MLARRGCGLAILALLCLQGTSFGQQAFWQPDVEAAKRLAAQTNRLVLIHFSATWCQPCARLEDNVFRKPGFSAAMERQYVGVKLNFDDNRKLVAQYGIQAIPADVIITPQGQVVQKVQSPPTIENYVGVMQQVAARASKMPGMVASTSPPAAAAQTPSSAPAMSPPPAAQKSNLSDDRYADYFAGLRASQGTAGNNPIAAAAPEAQTAMPGQPSNAMLATQAMPPSAYAAAPPAATTPATPMAAAGLDRSTPPPANSDAQMYWALQSSKQSAAQTSAGSPPAAATVTAPPAGRTLQLPPGSPPLGLEGYCPVTLVERQAWKEGDVRYGAIHHGRTYLFASQTEQQHFLANPDAFSPVMSGDDPVLALDENKSVPGKRKHGVFFGNRIYLFSTEATLTAFSKNPGRYAPEITQARR